MEENSSKEKNLNKAGDSNEQNQIGEEEDDDNDMDHEPSKDEDDEEDMDMEGSSGDRHDETEQNENTERRSAQMSSLTGFLFGNIDKDGHLDEDFLDEVINETSFTKLYAIESRWSRSQTGSKCEHSCFHTFLLLYLCQSYFLRSTYFIC